MPTQTDEIASTEERILDAVLTVLARRGIAGVSMRAVASEANVAVGLASYHFENKASLIAAALERIGQEDGDLVTARPGVEPKDRLRAALRHVLTPEFLAADYLALRLQLWSLAGVDPLFARINQDAQLRYRSGLVNLVAAARPDLSSAAIEERSADILIIQNGVWLTSILIVDQPTVDRSLRRCEEIAFGTIGTAERDSNERIT